MTVLPRLTEGDLVHTDLPGSYWTDEAAGLMIENNRWGGDYHQVIYVRHDPHPAGTPVGGWAWDCPDPAFGETAAVRGYPEVVYGWKPWAPSSTCDPLPCPLSRLPSLTADYAVQWDATGRLNIAFDMWLSSTERPKPETRAAEVMVWLYRQDHATPAGSPLPERFTGSDGRVWAVWSAPVGESGWDEAFPYVAFAPELYPEGNPPLPDGVLELSQFVREAARRGLVPADSFLASIEFGTEIWYGQGSLVLNRYTITPGPR